MTQGGEGLKEGVSVLDLSGKVRQNNSPIHDNHRMIVMETTVTMMMIMMTTRKKMTMNHMGATRRMRTTMITTTMSPPVSLRHTAMHTLPPRCSGGPTSRLEQEEEEQEEFGSVWGSQRYRERTGQLLFSPDQAKPKKFTFSDVSGIVEENAIAGKRAPKPRGNTLFERHASASNSNSSAILADNFEDSEQPTPGAGGEGGGGVEHEEKSDSDDDSSEYDGPSATISERNLEPAISQSFGNIHQLWSAKQKFKQGLSATNMVKHATAYVAAGAGSASFDSSSFDSVVASPDNKGTTAGGGLKKNSSLGSLHSVTSEEARNPGLPLSARSEHDHDEAHSGGQHDPRGHDHDGELSLELKSGKAARKLIPSPKNDGKIGSPQHTHHQQDRQNHLPATAQQQQTPTKNDLLKAFSASPSNAIGWEDLQDLEGSSDSDVADEANGGAAVGRDDDDVQPQIASPLSSAHSSMAPELSAHSRLRAVAEAGRAGRRFINGGKQAASITTAGPQHMQQEAADDSSSSSEDGDAAAVDGNS
mmetsp:Transcript_12340/g.20515  ORF Transcript_12340/g.20515 Transcript_12340/m.20515 type:complete len:532 (+) Transcript_12340:1535-3130(+)